MKKNTTISFESICIKDFEKAYTTLPHQLPIYATSSFEFENIDHGINIFTGKESGHVYSRYANPTIDAVANKIAALEVFGTSLKSWGIMTSSGMSAISTLTLAILKQGDALLTQANLYGGTTELFQKVLKTHGIDCIFTDLQDSAQVASILKNNTSIKAIYLETPANPSMTCIDLGEMSQIAKKYQCSTIVDNTFATPYLQQPFIHGIDYIIHSTTKFLNGHGNATAGIIVGLGEENRKKVWEVMKLIGTNCNPFDAWLTNNGLKTLVLRMDKHSSNAQQLAEYLENHSKVKKVNYVGLPSHQDHKVASQQMTGFGGMLSFELKGGIDTGIAFMNKIKFCTLAPTLGDTDTLILHPASMSHLNIPKDIREANGITDGLIRLSVGIEGIDDIINDIEQALG